MGPWRTFLVYKAEAVGEEREMKNEESNDVVTIFVSVAFTQELASDRG
jgi:hypothetical protein